MKKYLLTYGTLMNNRCRNDFLLNCGFRYVKDFHLHGYSIHDYTQGGYPVILPGCNSNVVVGELWEFPDVDNIWFAQIVGCLDTIEGEGKLYKRKSIKVDGKDTAFVYVGIPKFWNRVRLNDATIGDDGKWVGGDYIA